MISGHTDNGSYWFDSVDRKAAGANKDTIPGVCDVAIIGAGFSGLWTAYYLKKAQPDLNISIFEANCVGFGASGRNGGWCYGTTHGIEAMLDDPATREDGLALLHALQDTVDEVGRITQTENIECNFKKGGALLVATSQFHIDRLKADVERLQKLNFSESEHGWLTPEAVSERVSIVPNYGARYNAHCAVVHPVRLAAGLARVLHAKGVKIHENCPVTEFTRNKLTVAGKTVTADFILRATEGYTDSIRSERRELIPLYTFVIATEPLPDLIWDNIGLLQREAFADLRRTLTYGQRTADGRFVFGGRARYNFGSKLVPTIEPTDPVFPKLESILRSFFPSIGNCKVTHRWGGLMGMARHYHAYVTFDQDSGLGVISGFIGEGVAATNLGARILSDLVLGYPSELTRLPWVNDAPPLWEREPARWLGAKMMEKFAEKADHEELVEKRPSTFWGKWYDKYNSL